MSIYILHPPFPADSAHLRSRMGLFLAPLYPIKDYGPFFGLDYFRKPMTTKATIEAVTLILKVQL